MLLFLVIIVLSFLIGAQRCSDKGKGKGESIFVGIMTSGMAGSVYMLLILILLIPFSAKVERYVESEKVEIVSLRNILSTEGDFFLGTGSIGSNLYYVYRYKTNRGSTKMALKKGDKAETIEEKRSDAYLAKLTKELNHPGLVKWDWLAIPGFIICSSNDSGYVFHVPEGSVKKNIDLNLMNLKP